MAADLSERITIDRPIEEVFELMANPKNAKDMFVNVSEVESLDDNEKQVGAKYREYRQLTNRRVGTDIEITRREQNQEYGFKSLSNGLVVEYRYTFQEIEPGITKVTFESKVFPKKMMMRLTKLLIIRMLKKEDQDHLKFVKTYMEKEA